jgi:chemotaxis protein histidine kinase CheA
VGRKEVVGRPLLYGTTKEFLHYFGLKDLSDMPTLKDLQDILKADEAGKSWELNEQGELIARMQSEPDATEEQLEASAVSEMPEELSEASAVSEILEELSEASAVSEILEELSEASAVSETSEEVSDQSAVPEASEEFSEASAVFDPTAVSDMPEDLSGKSDEFEMSGTSEKSSEVPSTPSNGPDPLETNVAKENA